MSISLPAPGGAQPTELSTLLFARAPQSKRGCSAGGLKLSKFATNAFHRSGQLNAKQRELAELQALAQRRLKGARVNFAEGIEAAKETRRDLDYTQKKLS